MAVGRLFTEIGQNVDRMNASLRQMMTTAQEAGVKVTGSGQAMLSKFQDALKPAEKFREQIELLGKAGASQADIQKVMGDSLLAAADKCRKAGEPIDDLIKKYVSLESRMKATGEGMLSFGKSMSLYVTAPIMAIGVGVIKASSDINEGMNIIRTGTGAMGDKLAGLGESFRNVFHDVPDSAKEVSTAIADLNTRLGLTGKPLEDMANQMLNLGRLTGTQVGPIVAATTRLFGDWSVATSKQAETLDYLFKVTQQTGIGFQRLTELTVQYGAPLRSLGFDIEQSAAMLGKWEKEGVNMETVLAGMRFALGNFAKAGKDPVEALTAIQNAIKGAKTESEATAIAFAAFGKRAAADMGRAIIEGRFNLEDLIKSLKASKTTINETEEANKTFAESMQVLKNQTELALEPLGTALVKVLKSLVPAIESAVKWIADMLKGFADLDPFTQKAILAFGAVTAAIGPMSMAIGGAMKAISGVMTAMSSFGSLTILLNPMTLAIIAAAAAFGILAYEISKAIRENDKMVLSMSSAEHMTPEMTARVKELEDRLKSQGVTISKTGLTLKEYTDKLLLADTNLKHLATQSGTTSGMFDSYNKIMTVGAGVVANLDKTVKTLTDDQQKLLTKHNESLAPLSKITAEYKELIGIGANVNSFILQHKDAIIKTGTEQVKFSLQVTETADGEKHFMTSLTDADAALLAQAMQLQRTATAGDALNDDLLKWTASMKEYEKQVLNTQLVVQAALQAEIDKNTEAFEKMKIKNPMKAMIPDAPTEKELKDAWENSQAMIEGVMSETTKKVRASFGDLFLDINSSLAKSIIEWSNPAGRILAALENFGEKMLTTIADKFLGPFEDKLASILANLATSLLNGVSGQGWNFSNIFASAGGGGGSAGSGGGAGGGGGGGGIVPGIIGLGAGAAGIYASTQQSGAASWATGLAGGASAGAGLAALFPALMSTPWGAAIGAAAFALSKGIPKLIDVFQGKNAWQAGAPEALRDFAVDVTKDQFQAFAEYLGQSESSTYGIRKEILSSPFALTQLLGPLAKQSGTMDDFLKKLEKVTTSWGEFNLRGAYEAGSATGDYSELNKLWSEKIGSISTELAKWFPDWSTKLMAAVTTAATTAATTTTGRAVGGTRPEELPVHWINQIEQAEMTRAAAFGKTRESIDEFERALDRATTGLRTNAESTGRWTNQIEQAELSRAAAFGKGRDSVDGFTEALDRSTTGVRTNAESAMHWTNQIEQAELTRAAIFGKSRDSVDKFSEALDRSTSGLRSNAELTTRWINQIEQAEMMRAATFGKVRDSTDNLRITLDRAAVGFRSNTESTVHWVNQIEQAERTRASTWSDSLRAVTDSARELARGVDHTRGSLSRMSNELDAAAGKRPSLTGSPELDRSKHWPIWLSPNQNLVAAPWEDKDKLTDRLITAIEENTVVGRDRGVTVNISGDVYGYDDFARKVAAANATNERRGVVSRIGTGARP